MGYLQRHEARDNQRAFHQITGGENLHPKYGKLFQGSDGIGIFGLRVGRIDRTYPNFLNDILPVRIDSVTDQDSEWYSQLIYGDSNYRQQLIQQMVNEFNNNDIPNLISNDREHLPIIDDLNSQQLLIKYILPLDQDWTILGYPLPEEFHRNSRAGMKIDLASPTDIERWSKTNDQSTKTEYERALVLIYEVPTVDPNEVQGSLQLIAAERELDLDWLTSLLEYYRRARDKHRDELIRGVAETVAKKVNIYSKAYNELQSFQIRDSSAQRKPETRLGRIFKPWLVDVNGCICVGCQRNFCFDQLVVDHVVPWEICKTTSFDNLQLLCVPCNTLKDNGTMDEFRQKLEEQGGPMNDACCDGTH